MKVIARNIKDAPVKIFNPDGTLLCETDNMLTFNDIRVQIKEQEIEGYYIKFDGERIDIDKEGNPISHPTGLFDISLSQLNCLFLGDRINYNRENYDPIQNE